MNKYNREELLYMFGYCFQVLKTVSDLDKAISAEQNKAYDGIMDKYYRIKKVFNIIIISFILIVNIFGPIIYREPITSLIILQIPLSYGFFQLLFFPIFAIVKAFYNQSAKKEFSNAYDNDASNKYRQKGVELLRDKQFLDYKEEIPEDYFNMDDLYLLYSYLETYRADNFKEAANLLAEEKHRERVEYNQELMQSSLATIQDNVRYQSVIQTIQLLETRTHHRIIENR
ncbi:hypothetical protein MK409_08700 [Streptococcus oralis]|jgi:hypothetical protein|uniref:hypothetical protein n=1 Tax=Streptococcus oralis TaxID=1303 RepID=UPI0022843227|nr:hypothetical protein [Streptococcus oralis]MCY7098128.1 hypothetical protein [Streptococcus oralis]